MVDLRTGEDPAPGIYPPAGAPGNSLAAHARVSVQLYRELRDFLCHQDPDVPELMRWLTHLAAPTSPEQLAGEVIWVILCAGRSAQAARTIEAKVRAAHARGESAVTVFGYRAKAAAMDRAWTERHEDFAAFQRVSASGDPWQLAEWCGSLPYVGEVTKWQLLRNLGHVQAPKPDVWLCRLAGIPDKPSRKAADKFASCMALCQPLSEATGDTIALVDVLLWVSCNKGYLRVDAGAGEIRFVAASSSRRSIFDPAPSADHQLQVSLAGESPTLRQPPGLTSPNSVRS